MAVFSWYNPLAIIIVAILALYGLLVVALYYRQELLIFPATPLPANHPFDFDVPFEELSIPVDGAQLNALHFRQPRPRGLVFFLHGNAGNLATWTTGVDFYQRVNYDMFIFDYRGYGKSSGRIQSEQQLFSDVKQAWDFIAPQYAGKPVVIYGRSLGTALAVELATKVSPDLLVLVSPYSSMEAMAKQRYPLVPSGILRYPLRTDEMIGQVQSETVILHGSEDAFIPLTHSYELQPLINAPLKLLTVDGAGHNDIHQFPGYLEGFANVLP